MLEITLVGGVRRTRGRLEAEVAAWEQASLTAAAPALIYQDVVLLDVAKQREAFAVAVVQRCANGTTPEEIEGDLLTLYQAALQQQSQPSSQEDDDADEGQAPNTATKLVRLALQA